MNHKMSAFCFSLCVSTKIHPRFVSGSVWISLFIHIVCRLCLFCRYMLYITRVRSSAHQPNQMKWFQLTLTFVRHNVKRRIIFFPLKSKHICGFWFSSYSIHFFIYMSLERHSAECIADLTNKHKYTGREWEWRMSDTLNAILLTHFVEWCLFCWDFYFYSLRNKKF